MKKCIIISTEASAGSVGSAVCRDASEALREGYDVTIATARGVPPLSLRKAGVKHAKIGSKIEFLTHAFFARAFDGEGRGSQAATRKLARLIRKLRPERIVLHNLHGYYLNLKILSKHLLRAAEGGAEIRWTFHDFAPLTGHCAFLPAEGCDHMHHGCGSCPMSGAYPRTFIDRSKKNFERRKKLLAPLVPYLRIYCVSDWLAQNVKKSFFSEAKSIDVRYPEVAPVFCPQGPKTGYVLAAAYPWQKWKGYEDLFELRRKVPSEIPMVVVGANNRQKRRLAQAGMIPVGPLTKAEDMAWYYRRA